MISDVYEILCHFICFLAPALILFKCTPVQIDADAARPLLLPVLLGFEIRLHRCSGLLVHKRRLGHSACTPFPSS